MDKRLLLVTQSGSVDALYSLVKEDPTILGKVDGLPFINTPLHEVSATKKIDLAVELMILKPSFAKKLNADGFSPLHIAVEKQNAELALELVKFHPTLVRIRGREGITPLHLVAKNGDVDLLTEFLRVCPQSIQDANVNGETALHIMVLNGRAEELEVLTGWLQRMRNSDAAACILNKRDREGNTALHLAAYENRRQAAKQLLNCMLLNRNILNNSGKTALDVVRDNEPHMKKLIKKTGGKNAISLSKVERACDLLRKPVTFKEYCRTEMARYRSRMSDGTRNSLLVITGLIIAATYQHAVQAQEEPAVDYTSVELIEKLFKWLNNLETVKRWDQPILNLLLLWVFDTAAFFLAIIFTFILLPESKSYKRWYICCMVPLICSYLLAIYMKCRLPGVLAFMYLMVLVGFLMYLLVSYNRWKKNTPKKVPKLKFEVNYQEFKSEDHVLAPV